MTKKIPRMFFDEKDHALLDIVNDVLNRDKSLQHLRKLLTPHFHSQGIKEMAATSGLRMAYAAIHLLGSLRTGEAQERLEALQSLRDEALSKTHSTVRKNTARVLLQIMKELIRSEGDEIRMLKLARDFRIAALGKPKVIKNELRKYHLVEMPEEWNQVAFDHHVHDVNTKGRKSATHLIMDAWIKGIRKITVVHYNYVRTEAITELLEAASIMNMEVQIGIEFYALFQDKYIKIVWLPRDFADNQDFISFFSSAPVLEFMKKGESVSAYQQKYVLDVLDEFNKVYRLHINQHYGISMLKLDKDAFLDFVGIGQISIFHLAKFIYNTLMHLMRERVKALKPQYEAANEDEKKNISLLVKEMNCIDSESIITNWLAPDKNAGIHNPWIPFDSPDIPSLLKLSAKELLSMLSNFCSAYSATLSLTNLSTEEVLELLYDCNGMITNLEIFNLKDYSEGNLSPDLSAINELQIALNHGNIIKLKRIVYNIIEQFEDSVSGKPGKQNVTRRARLAEILFDIEKLHSLYKNHALKSRIGSDSTGRSRHLHGMGLIIKDTLPVNARKEFDTKMLSRESIPVTATSYKRVTFIPRTSFSSAGNFYYKILRHFPGGSFLGSTKISDWVLKDYSLHMGRPGNIATLGGIQEECDNGLMLETPAKKSGHTLPLKYLNSHFKNALMILLGFIPAFLTFALTKDWWLLAYGGAFIWFGITGLRNILQSVLGGGGFRRSPLLRWNSYLSWERISDSLFFTGLSVPLLDYLVKSLFLDRLLNINTTTSPIMLYTIIAVVNGIYITSHNIFRGLPKNAALGNFFRAIISIPIAIGFNYAIGGLLLGCGAEAVSTILQKWAVVISKAASDCVAGLIEGLADRGNNMRMRFMDYTHKIKQLFETFSKLDLLCPEVDLIKVLESPKEFMVLLSTQNEEIVKPLFIHALDFLYFWMYQPRARIMLKHIMRSMSREERKTFVRSQSILLQQREISQLFIDGIVGKNFSKALAFYLDSSEEYLEALNKEAAKLMAS